MFMGRQRQPLPALQQLHVILHVWGKLKHHHSECGGSPCPEAQHTERDHGQCEPPCHAKRCGLNTPSNLVWPAFSYNAFEFGTVCCSFTNVR